MRIFIKLVLLCLAPFSAFAGQTIYIDQDNAGEGSYFDPVTKQVLNTSSIDYDLGNEQACVRGKIELVFDTSLHHQNNKSNYIFIKNKDVDYPQEIDGAYWNNQSLGKLIGRSNDWTSTLLEIPNDNLYSRNLLEVNVSEEEGGESSNSHLPNRTGSWCVYMPNIQLLVGGGKSVHKVESTRIDYSNRSNGQVTIAPVVELDITTTGNFQFDFSVIGPDDELLYFKQKKFHRNEVFNGILQFDIGAVTFSQPDESSLYRLTTVVSSKQSDGKYLAQNAKIDVYQYNPNTGFGVFPVEDSDLDGVLDVFEVAEDLDGDQSENKYDADDDGDGVDTRTELKLSKKYASFEELMSIDTDLDNIPNYLDKDDDNDGIPSKDESKTEDADGDEIVAYLDPDEPGICFYDPSKPDVDGDKINDECDKDSYGPEAPAVLQSQILENKDKNTQIVNFNGLKDKDGDGNKITYKILTASISDVFSINKNTGIISVASKEKLDAENLPETIVLKIKMSSKAKDELAKVIEFDYLIKIIDVDDNEISQLKDANSQANTVYETANLGTTVGITAHATDADVKANIVYSLVLNPANKFSINPSTGVVVTSNTSSFNADLSSSFKITVAASSNSLRSISKNFTINIIPDLTDTDGDEIRDHVDPDKNNPCIPNNNSFACDSDSDGLTNNQEQTLGTDPNDADSDNDGINDKVEVGNVNSPTDSDKDGVIDALEDNTQDVDGDKFFAHLDRDDANSCIPNMTADTCDKDNDGLSHAQEVALGTDPNKADSDNDGIKDKVEVGNVNSPTDSDKDGVIDALENNTQDLDNDGVFAHLDSNEADSCIPNATSSSCDKDNDGLTHAQEVALGTNPNKADSDNDGINDKTEVGNINSPTDSDKDGVIDALENNTQDLDNDGVFAHLDSNEADNCIPDATSSACDKDNDGLTHAQEVALGTDPNKADSDNDGIKDKVEVGNVNSPTDSDKDGVIDALENNTQDLDNDGVFAHLDSNEADSCIPNATSSSCDKDNDGLTHAQEVALGTNPNKADSDNDGINDKTEVGNINNPTDSDKDGVIDALENNTQDLDNDGVFAHLDSNEADNCIPNATSSSCDKDNDGLTHAQEVALGTDPNKADSDNDGINDKTEIGNINSPTDSDKDGVIDALENNTQDLDNDGVFAHLDSNEADSCIPNATSSSCDKDNDGLTHAQEIALGTDPNKVDSDNDGINDKTEVGNINSPTDSDKDGVIDALENNTQDLDNDGVFAHLDSNEADSCIPNATSSSCDKDNDGLTHAQEIALGTNPNRADSDNDGIKDKVEVGDINNPTDSDKDGVINALENNTQDLDNDGVFAHLDSNEADSCVPNANSDLCDADKDGLTNAQEKLLGTNPNNADTDGDGVNDGAEVGNINNPNDSDRDGVIDALESLILDGDKDGINDQEDANNGSACTPDNTAGLCDVDNDGLTNDEEKVFGTNPFNPDTDGDGIKDGAEASLNTDGDDANNALESNLLDSDNDGVMDHEDAFNNDACRPSNTVAACDADNDGLSNAQEAVFGTNPLNADTDGDGIKDGDEAHLDTDGDRINDALESNIKDADKDGLMDHEDAHNGAACMPDNQALTCDADNDGLTNEQEISLATNPLWADSDGDGLADGIEVENAIIPLDSDGDDIIDALESILLDQDQDGVVDQSDPYNNDACRPNRQSGTCDADNDGLTNEQEIFLGTHTENPDSDGDGLTDGEEGFVDTDGDEKVDANENNNADQDGDGVNDHLDGNDSNACDPNVLAGACDQDNDGLTNAEEATLGTSPTNNDTDGDGLTDGAEVVDVHSPKDSDKDGIIDALENNLADSDKDGINDHLDANNGSACTPDNSAGACDHDNDGLTNAQEASYGTNPRNPDTDGDGIKDGDEAHLDTDGDRINDALESNIVDSDNDGLMDHEDANNGAACSPNNLAPSCDQDNDGLTNEQEAVLKTDPNNPDSDGDGVADGIEVGDVNNPADADGDRTIDALESNKKDSDKDGLVDQLDPENNDACQPDNRSGSCDQDNDGLTNAQEILLGTNPHHPDSDGDGISDGAEVVHVNNPKDSDKDGIIDALEDNFGDSDKDGVKDHLDANNGSACTPNNRAAACDHDNDGLTNSQEQEAGTNPNNPDSDGDGLPDGVEVFGVNNTGSVSVPVDTDGDRIIDALESNLLDSDRDGIVDQLDANNGQSCEPNNNADECDNDGDGLTVAQERLVGTDPFTPDTDGDGRKDGFEIGLNINKPNDTDLDGKNDAIESIILDSDRDGIVDQLDNKDGTECIPDDSVDDCDADNDGLTNAQEKEIGTDPRNADTDGDGIKDGDEYLTDADNDGIIDALESNTLDTDKDGIPNYLDGDSDGDGILDADEISLADVLIPAPGTDTSGGGDSDQDGISDKDEIGPDPKNPLDVDQDDIPNYLDLDSDNNGIEDFNEQGGINLDTDADGLADYTDLDDDNDGLDDVAELPENLDADGDRIPDYKDKDSDSSDGLNDSDLDGISDVIEFADKSLPVDTDRDKTPDYMDLDSDADGISDNIEADGIDNLVDDIVAVIPIDSDGDGLADYIDLDADNDGILDRDELAEDGSLIDVDQDGIPDYVDADTSATNDSDNDGLTDSEECPVYPNCPDRDNDGRPDYLDSSLDSDDDGIPDSDEDSNRDRDNNPATRPLDSDGDGTPDYQDKDSDNDGLLDREERRQPYNPNDRIDTDGDGINDVIDASNGVTEIVGGQAINEGGDSDRDGIPDKIECPTQLCVDSDNDGTPNYFDSDSDNDGKPDVDEIGNNYYLPKDSDKDGIPDYLDLTDDPNAKNGGDSDGDGVADKFECPNYPACPDQDNDGIPDYLDKDSIVNASAQQQAANRGGVKVGAKTAGSFNALWLLMLGLILMTWRKSRYVKSTD